LDAQKLRIPIVLPDIVSLALFVSVAELRSLTKAAQTQHIALAAASRRIQFLEYELDAQLLNCSVRGAELTPAGRAALYHARQILLHVEHMRAELAEYGKGRKGCVRLQGNPSAISQCYAIKLPPPAPSPRKVRRTVIQSLW
jgi:DNA-binding transcriptional LysR family regulator